MSQLIMARAVFVNGVLTNDGKRILINLTGARHIFLPFSKGEVQVESDPLEVLLKTQFTMVIHGEAALLIQ